MISRLEKQKQDERRQRAHEWARQAETPMVNLGKYFKHIATAKLRGKSAYLTFRVSTPQQERDLPAQIMLVVRSATKAGLQIKGAGAWVTNGANPTFQKQVAEAANKAGAEIIVFESTSRAIRHPDWGRDNFHTAPTQVQLDEIKRVHKSRKLVTVLPPDASFEEERAHQIKRGLRYRKAVMRTTRSKKGSRRRVRSLWRAMIMRINGISLGKIAQELGVSKAQVQAWLRCTEL